MTKLTKSRSGRQGNGPDCALDGLLRSPSSLFRLVLHGFLCIAALILGFRLSREALLVVVSFSTPERTPLSRSITKFYDGGSLREGSEVALKFPYVKEAGQGSTWLQAGKPLPPAVKSRRVHVGRHEILVRPWPHPDPVQTIIAHQLMDLVQHEQRRTYRLKERRRLLVITPTYVRTFQAVHLACLIHTLRIVPSPLIWIVVEAGGVSNETATLLTDSQIFFYHLGFQEAMPGVWEERRRHEARMRFEGLRFIRERRLDGLVVFADDSNTYNVDFFDEVQKVKWIGAFSVGLLFHSGLQGDDSGITRDGHLSDATENKLPIPSLPLQGPACNSTGHIIGWHAPKKYENGSGSSDLTARSLEWAGFSLNSRLLWEEIDKPTGIKSWNELSGDTEDFIQTPLDFLKNASLLEPLGNCGRDVLVWWLRVEARADSKFPSRWVIHPSLEIVVPSKWTPWPDPPVGHPPPPPPPLPVSSDLTNQHDKHRSKQSAKGGRGKRGPHHSEKRKQALSHNKTYIQQSSQILGISE